MREEGAGWEVPWPRMGRVRGLMCGFFSCAHLVPAGMGWRCEAWREGEEIEVVIGCSNVLWSKVRGKALEGVSLTKNLEQRFLALPVVPGPAARRWFEHPRFACKEAS